ncbi:hypothetical protein L1987_30707 [Smallanthus sonchifolius]|uniref:Uncharacterized protein n=1 Tax=Smallanthus sonchifolius TaxID=185202 RepID=A0ACB9I2X8_9ASTR|nr:hypothetical protein L1987_30707 [Smallanthus sonchifolius]
MLGCTSNNPKRMKKGVSLFLKNIISRLTSLTKSKSLAIKSKVESMKARVIICSLLKNKKLPFTIRTSSISHKIHALLLGATEDNNNHQVLESTNVDYNLQLVLHKENSLEDEYHHSLFDQEDDNDLGDPDGSVVDLVMEHDGEDFRLEDEIDRVADLFIMKFHKRMRLQKLESFKRYQDMLERSS